MNKINYLVWFATVFFCFLSGGLTTLLIINFGEIIAFIGALLMMSGWILAASYFHFVLDDKEEKVKCKK